MHLLHLSSILRQHLRNRGLYDDAETLHRQALLIAHDTGHQTAELDALTGLGHVHRQRGRYDQAIELLGQALRLACTSGYQPAELQALDG